MSDGAPQPPPRARHRVEWDRVTAIMAVLIGACALAVSLYTAHLQNAQVRAQTWPYLQLWQSTAERSFSMTNSGVGPARILDVKLLVRGKQVPDFRAAFSSLSQRTDAPSTNQSYFARRVLTANETVTMIQFRDEADYRVFADNRDAIQFQICYCSVLDQCFQLDEAAPTPDLYLASVPSCPAGEPGQFR